MNTKKEYYSQKDLIDFDLTPLSKRALCFRFAKLVREGKLVYGTNLFKAGKEWQIHNSLVPLFEYQSILNLRQDLPFTIG